MRTNLIRILIILSCGLVGFAATQPLATAPAYAKVMEGFFKSPHRYAACLIAPLLAHPCAFVAAQDGARGDASVESPAEKALWLSQLDLSKAQQECWPAQPDRAITGEALSIAGQKFEKGVGSHANSALRVRLHGSGKRYGVSPCLAHRWGDNYYANIRNFIEQTGLSLVEDDGSYPGDVCASTNHTGHHGLGDSKWNQWKQITDFYK